MRRAGFTLSFVAACLTGVLAASAHGIRKPDDAAKVIAEVKTLTGDATRGEATFRKTCGACHTLESGGRHKIGPNLHGALQRKPATAEGYNYSPALSAAGLEWNDATLTRFIAYPFGVVPETKMDYWLRSSSDIADVVAYLRVSPATHTKAP
jgi:cytochrome c